MLTQALRNFVANRISLYGQRGEKWALILHTSCVCYGEDDLRAAAEMPEFYWIVPDNVRYELQLLREESRFPNFRRNAKLILDKVQQSSIESFQWWDLEDLYLPYEKSGLSRPLWVPSDICSCSMIFAFGNPLKEEEFLRRTPDWPGDYYILFNKTWDPNEVASIQNIRAVKDYPLIHPQVITPGTQEISPDTIKTETYYLELSSGKERIPGSDLKELNDIHGNYAKIYAVPRHPDLVLKFYRYAPLDAVFERKLRCMMAYGVAGKNVPVQFPVALLTTADGTIVGYAMRKAQGITLRTLLTTPTSRGHDLNLILRNLTLLLIELHSLGFIVNDLSYNNIMVDDQDRVYLVDTDSFQMCDYPGGTMTSYYRHPGVRGNLYATLRDPVYEYFAYAVLQQQCYMGLHNPLGDPPERREGDPEPDWDNTPFDPDRNYPDSALGIWNSLEALGYRTGMLREFTFQEDLSFGAWLRIQNFFA